MTPLILASFERLQLCTFVCFHSVSMCLFGIQGSAHSQMTDACLLVMSVLVHIKFTNILVIEPNVASAQLVSNNRTRRESDMWGSISPQHASRTRHYILLEPELSLSLLRHLLNTALRHNLVSSAEEVTVILDLTGERKVHIQLVGEFRNCGSTLEAWELNLLKLLRDLLVRIADGLALLDEVVVVALLNHLLSVVLLVVLGSWVDFPRRKLLHGLVEGSRALTSDTASWPLGQGELRDLQTGARTRRVQMGSFALDHLTVFLAHLCESGYVCVQLFVLLFLDVEILPQLSDDGLHLVVRGSQLSVVLFNGLGPLASDIGVLGVSSLAVGDIDYLVAQLWT